LEGVVFEAGAEGGFVKIHRRVAGEPVVGVAEHVVARLAPLDEAEGFGVDPKA